MSKEREAALEAELAKLREAVRDVLVAFSVVSPISREAKVIEKLRTLVTVTPPTGDAVKAPERVYREVAPNVFEDITGTPPTGDEGEPITREAWERIQATPPTGDAE